MLSSFRPGQLTINEHDGLFDGVLIAELRVEQRSADKGAIVGGLVPAHMQMVNVDVAQRTHHLHLVLDYRQREEYKQRSETEKEKENISFKIKLH